MRKVQTATSLHERLFRWLCLDSLDLINVSLPESSGDLIPLAVHGQGGDSTQVQLIVVVDLDRSDRWQEADLHEKRYVYAILAFLSLDMRRYQITGSLHKLPCSLVPSCAHHPTSYFNQGFVDL